MGTCEKLIFFNNCLTPNNYFKDHIGIDSYFPQLQENAFVFNTCDNSEMIG